MITCGGHNCCQKISRPKPAGAHGTENTTTWRSFLHNQHLRIYQQSNTHYIDGKMFAFRLRRQWLRLGTCPKLSKATEDGFPRRLSSSTPTWLVARRPNSPIISASDHPAGETASSIPSNGHSTKRQTSVQEDSLLFSLPPEIRTEIWSDLLVTNKVYTPFTSCRLLICPA